VAFIAILINLVAVITTYGKTDTSGFAVGSLIASIFAYGIFHNYRADPENAPTYAVWLSITSGLTGLVLLVQGIL